MSKNKQKDICLACGKAFNKTDSSIQCAICALWIHHKPCSGVSEDGFKFLSEQVQATGTAYWACRSCLAYSKGITMKVKEVEKKLEEVQKELKENAKEIGRVDKIVEQLRQDLEKVKEKKNDESNNYITAEEYREREARRLNLIFHRVPESLDRDAVTRREADLLECSNILRAIGLGNSCADIKLCRRLGEKSDEPRPLIVILRSEATRTALLESARHLRNTQYSFVSIVPDLTKNQTRRQPFMKRWSRKTKTSSPPTTSKKTCDGGWWAPEGRGGLSKWSPGTGQRATPGDEAAACQHAPQHAGRHVQRQG
jgi:hypothetical protein